MNFINANELSILMAAKININNINSITINTITKLKKSWKPLKNWPPCYLFLILRNLAYNPVQEVEEKAFFTTPNLKYL